MLIGLLVTKSFVIVIVMNLDIGIVLFCLITSVKTLPNVLIPTDSRILSKTTAWICPPSICP